MYIESTFLFPQSGEERLEGGVVVKSDLVADVVVPIVDVLVIGSSRTSNESSLY
jgi:hypothetical protein